MAKGVSPGELALKAKNAHDAGRMRFTARIELGGSGRTDEEEGCSFAVEAIEGAGWVVDHFSVTDMSNLAYVLFKRR